MADAFRGLTLRIGADARPVKSALDSISRSAGQTQKQLNKMSKALKFDGNNLGALRQAISLADDKASHMAMSMRTAATAMKQAASETAGFGRHSQFFGQTIAEAARNIKNVNSHIQQTREQAKTTNAQLQHIYDSAKKIVESRLYAPFATAEQKAKLADDVIKQIQRDLQSTGPKAESAFDAMRKFITEATTNKKMNLSERFGLGKTEADAEKLYETFVKLREKSSEFDSDLKALKNVGGFQALKTEVLAYESSLREAAAETVRYKAELASIGAAPGLARAMSDIKGIKSATQAAVEQARIMDDAYKATPRSIDIARGKIVATKAAQQALTEQIKQMRAAMQKIERSPGFDKLAASSSNVHLEFERAKSAATEAAVAVQRVEGRIKELNHQRLAFIGPQSESDLAELDNRIKKLNSELAELRTRADSADEALDQAAAHRQYAQLAADIAKANTELAELKTRSSALNAFKNFGAGLREVGYGLYSTVTPALMMAGRYAIQAAEDIDSAYRDMRKTVNGTEEQFEHLKQAAMDYSTTHVTSADQILEIEAMGGQLGIAAEDLEAFATTISNLDIATNINADEAAEQLGKMASVLGLTADDYDNFGDALVRLGNNMPVMESDIMTLTTRYMGMGKVVGMSADEMLAWSAAASATGQKSEAAGSSMQRFISNVETAVTSGGDELEKFASIAGMSSQEFVEKFGRDASGAMRDFVAGLGEMQRNGESVNQALKELGINNVRDKQLLEGLANQMANATDEASILDKALRMSSDAFKGLSTDLGKNGIEQAGDAAREAAKKAEGFSGSLQMMKNQAQVLGATLADSAAPFLRELGVMMADLTDKFRSMPEGMKTLTLQVLAFTAALGPAGVALGTLLRSSASVVSFLGNASKAIGLAGVKLTNWGELAAGAALEGEKGLMRAGKAATGLGKALSALGSTKALLAGAGISAYLAIVKHEYDSLIERNDQYVMATSRLKSSLDDIRSSYTLTASDMSTLNGVQDTASKSTDELIAQQANLSKAIIERNDNAKGTIASLTGAKDVISELMNRTERYGESAALTAVEQGRLKAAIEQVNSVCGTHYSVVDAMNGKIADERGELVNTIGTIGDYIEAKKRQIQADAMMQDLQDLYPQQLEWYTKLVDAQRKMQEANAGGDPFAQNAAAANLAEVASHYKDITNQINSLEDSLGSLSEQETKEAKTIGDLADRSMLIRSAFEGNADAFEGFKYELNNCGLTMQSFGDVSDETWAKAIATWLNGGGKMRDILQDLGVNVMDVAQQYQTELGNAGKSFDDFASAAGVSVDTLAESLNLAGLSAMQLSEMGIDGFNELLAAVDGDVTDIAALIDALNEKNIDPKDIHVNGDEITTATGDVYTLEEAADAVGNKTYTVTLSAESSKAQESVGSAQAAADEWGASEETAYIDEEGAEESEDAITSAQEAADEFGSTSASASISVNDYASDVIDSVKSKLNDLNGRSATVTIHQEGGNASGGIYAAHARGAVLRNAMGGIASRIPRNADGALNGIVTRATMTNIGWVGEAGAEAVFHMRNAGGAVVPLTNRRYVRPFARAVANEMSGGRQVNVTVNLNYSAGDDANRVARDVANRIETYLAMGA